MELNFTETAVLYLKKFISNDEILVLYYDTEGCGCAVNGVPRIIVTPVESRNGLEQIKTNNYDLYMYEKQKIFFDDELKIDYINNKLKLFSKNQVFTHHLSLK